MSGQQREAVVRAAREMMGEAGVCALVTLEASGRPRVCTMDPFPPDDDMIVWMGTNRRTRKVREIENDPRVTLYYAAPDGDGFVTISGTARLVDDLAEKAQRWKKEWDGYFTDRDATFILIKVTPKRLEIVSYRRGLVGDPDTWRPPSVEFNSDTSRE